MNKYSGRFASVSIGLLMAVSAGLLSAAPSTAAPAPSSVNVTAPASLYSDTFARQVHDLINAERTKVGSRPFAWNQSIADVSQDWANQLGVATKDPNWDFGTIHRTDAGGSLIPAGATWYRENIGFNGTPQQIVQWWMGSPGHKAAMLDPRGTDAGIGYVTQTSGPYAGLKLVVSNMAAYSSTPVPAPTSPTPIESPPALATGISETRLHAIDTTTGTLWGYKTPATNLSTRWNIGSGWFGMKQLISADWNNDGKNDLIARWNNGYVTMYAGLGNGDYKAPINIGGGGWQNYEMTVTKLRKTDTYPGVVARNTVDGNLYYYPNSNGGAMTSGRIQIGWGGWQAMSELSATDFDGDGNMDIIARSNSLGSMILYRTNGAGSFINEGRKTIGNGGWNVFSNISAEPDVAGPGSVGLIAKTGGKVLYYPISNGAIQYPSTLGGGGWENYMIADGSPRR